MAKPFSEQERQAINEKLIAACEEYWGLYGYHKTNIRDLCSKCGISPAAFYLFYESKELLFVETATRAVNRLLSIIDKNMPRKNPSKQDFAKALKIMGKKIKDTEWMVSLEKDFEILKRKLPPEMFKDFMDVYSFQAVKYQFSPTVSPQVAKMVLGTLLTLRFNKNMTGKMYDKVYEFIVDSVIDHLFE